jgi:hypothetical protein
MASKRNFTPEEWIKVLESVMLAGMAVSAADPNGLWGLTKEAFATRSALTASKLDAESNELIKAVIDDYESKEGRSTILEALRKRVAGAEPADILQRSLDDLREVSAILDARAPHDAAAFKVLLLGISQKVADAAMEHTFLGLGGVRVSDAEKATLADIAKALGTTA